MFQVPKIDRIHHQLVLFALKLLNSHRKHAEIQAFSETVHKKEFTVSEIRTAFQDKMCIKTSVHLNQFRL